MLKVRDIFRKTTGRDDSPASSDSSPEGIVSQRVKSFCESGTLPNSAGEEVLHLPVIVEAAESSPQAAKEAATQIRKFLGKEYYVRAPAQYNAFILIRILVDNPGATFTRNLDGKFGSTVKDLLRQSKDPSVQQIVRETLDFFEREKKDDAGLSGLIDMWAKEKGKMPGPFGANAVVGSGSRSSHAPRDTSGRRQHSSSASRSRRNIALPPPHELVGRVEEAKTSAKLLMQLLQSTPNSEVLDNDLIKEFADRCASASQSMQAFINAENPGPDEDTLLTLIETNDQLSLATSKHQRAVLQNKKAKASQGPSVSTGPPRPPQSGKTDERDPFGDENAPGAGTLQPPMQPTDTDTRNTSTSRPHDDEQAYLQLHAQEPFHPGFSRPAPRSSSEDLYETGHGGREPLPSDQQLPTQGQGPPPSSPQRAFPPEHGSRAGEGDRGGQVSAGGESQTRTGQATARLDYNTTPGYVHRQDSALDHTTMRGGTRDEYEAKPENSVSPIDTTHPVQYRY
ncbi:MAG: hypothetical protein M1833_006982 [Piccolia ochrophora]|nr:MAG: hypothetical protein M1833_006982 [Piccolia ochrophora]